MAQNAPAEVFKTSDGCTLAYTINAAGRSGAQRPGAPRMVLIHPLGLDRSVWAGAARRLAGEVETLSYDCRGHGQSERKAGEYSVELFARDLAELLDHVGWSSATIVGCSMGGCVALGFAGIYTPRVSALGLVNTTSWYGDEGPRQWQERAANARRQGLASLTDFQLTRWLSDDFRAAHPEKTEWARRVFLANSLDCYEATCGMLGRSDLRPYLGKLRMPTAIIAGEEDYATPVAASRQLHEAIAGSTLTILPKARHVTPVECEEPVAAILLELSRRS
jgi:3-oxoadipate enol-lactonase